MSKLSENPLSESPTAVDHPESAEVIPEFSPEQRKFLLSIAREAIAAGASGKSLPDSPPSPAISSSLSRAAASFPTPTASSSFCSTLLKPRGIFTTLYLDGELRGCVGYPMPIRPLYRAVAETAHAAAFEDSRFWPVSAEEVPELEISLSVLSPLFPIAPEQVEVGRHGLVISDGLRRGLLLPQVPAEHGWDRQTFLEQTCRKAGLPADAWRKSSATLEAFTAEVFGDADVSK